MGTPFGSELNVFKRGNGQLHLPRDGGEPLKIDLPARFVRVIMILQEAWERDELAGIPSPLRGFTNAEDLALLYEPQCPDAAPEAQTMTRYVSDLCVKISKCLDKPAFIVRATGRGARLADPVKVIKLGR